MKMIFLYIPSTLLCIGYQKHDIGNALSIANDSVPMPEMIFLENNSHDR